MDRSLLPVLHSEISRPFDEFSFGDRLMGLLVGLAIGDGMSSASSDQLPLVPPKKKASTLDRSLELLTNPCPIDSPCEAAVLWSVALVKDRERRHEVLQRVLQETTDGTIFESIRVIVDLLAGFLHEGKIRLSTVSDSEEVNSVSRDAKRGIIREDRENPLYPLYSALSCLKRFTRFDDCMEFTVCTLGHPPSCPLVGVMFGCALGFNRMMNESKTLSWWGKHTDRSRIEGLVMNIQQEPENTERKLLGLLHIDKQQE